MKYITEGIIRKNYPQMLQRTSTCKWKVVIIFARHHKNIYFLSKNLAYEFVRNIRKETVYINLCVKHYSAPCIMVKKNCGGEWVTVSAHSFDNAFKVVNI